MSTLKKYWKISQMETHLAVMFSVFKLKLILLRKVFLLAVATRFCKVINTVCILFIIILFIMLTRTLNLGFCVQKKDF